MLRTIAIGSCVLIQGLFVRANANGTISVQVGDQIYIGRPVLADAA
ncbi:hypothetical protein [Ruegeria aquimaris]|uniref:Uncharacterized protein n=1 Tax=Ruegeria aquimaris TaxID=2984333 RepID=A0ABT3AM64_9RHOB|nr:hypothetical protein [Ruegeria sp. XHP0148]MCV2889775.1 hypothetical protein [Ruegeria sp. XHP0148]